jgi:hypothetical protein
VTIKRTPPICGSSDIATASIIANALANGKTPPLTEAEYATFHGNYLNPHEINRYHDAARQVLAQHDGRLVEQFLESALADYRTEAARGHRGFRFWGVVEALIERFHFQSAASAD